MQLCYRGIKYEKSSTDVKPAAEKVVGKYRGVSLNAHLFDGYADHHPELKYRGVTVQAM
ncbi:MAG: DUF4278 domain-containing protein [Coleofasciculaceae cyanobacterium SM2_3_26]|nr:DUF4278 domain-containing protein [Coleofasciculaceae cyanobacterium SM2_3_26]